MRSRISFKLRQWWLKARACCRIIQSDAYVQVSMRGSMRNMTFSRWPSKKEFVDSLQLLNSELERIDVENEAAAAVEDLTNA